MHLVAGSALMYGNRYAMSVQFDGHGTEGDI